MKFIFTFLLLLLISIVYCNIFDDMQNNACKKQQEEYLGCAEAFINSNDQEVGSFKVLCTKRYIFIS